MTNFKQQLRAVGFAGDSDRFYCQVARLFGTHFPDWTDEQLKRHPREALRFCDIVRTALHLSDLGDEVILGGLENYRKDRKRLSKGAIAVS